MPQATGGLINILAPEIVVFDYNITKASSEIVASFMETVKKNVLPSHLAKLELRMSTLHSNISSIGGAVAVLDHCLEG